MAGIASGIGSKWLSAFPKSRTKCAVTNWVTLARPFSAKTSTSPRKPCEFGLLVDIDGVIVRGNKLIPGSKEAFHELLTRGESILLL